MIMGFVLAALMFLAPVPPPTPSTCLELSAEIHFLYVEGAWYANIQVEWWHSHEGYEGVCYWSWSLLDVNREEIEQNPAIPTYRMDPNNWEGEAWFYAPSEPEAVFIQVDAEAYCSCGNDIIVTKRQRIPTD